MASLRKILTIEKILNHFQIATTDGFVLCPKHSENTPSCKIYGGFKGVYCWGCGFHGGPVEFTAAYKGISEKHAVKYLCEAFGITKDSSLKLFQWNNDNSIFDDVLKRWHTSFMNNVWSLISDVPGMVHVWFSYYDRIDYFLEIAEKEKSLKPLEYFSNQTFIFLRWFKDQKE